MSCESLAKPWPEWEKHAGSLEALRVTRPEAVVLAGNKGAKLENPSSSSFPKSGSHPLSPHRCVGCAECRPRRSPLSRPWIVVPLVQAQMLWFLGRWLGPIDDHRIDRRLRKLLFHDAGSSGHHVQRAAGAMGHEALLGPFFTAVAGVLARLCPPKWALPSVASADCHSHCTPPSSSHTAAWFAQIRSTIPALAQRWNQSWTVLSGPHRPSSWSHWQPLRIRKMIALSVFRRLASLRPVSFLGRKAKRFGSIPSHNSSEIFQIVPSG